MPTGTTATVARSLIAAAFAAAIADALSFAFGMTWEILWALILGFALSAVVQSVVSKESITRLLPDDSPRSIAIACGLGAASSSCSYAAVALARSLFRKGANFTAAIAFEFASTNLVIELGIVLWLLMGWQFALAEFVGGPIMIAILALLFRSTLRPQLIEAARVQANRGLVGSMEGHAEMDMSVSGGSILSRILSDRGFTAISHSFVMDWAAIWKDIAGGLLIAGALAAWVPESFWQGFFLVDHPVLAAIWGPLVGPLVAMLSFVCSIGNVPLAAVLWNGGISFGGVAAFIYADLIVLPILNIYRKYYGGRVTAYLLVTFYAAMVAAGLIVELLFGALGLIPDERSARVVEASVTWNYTTVLNILFLVLAGVLVVRFLRTGGPAMLRMMDRAPAASSDAGPHADHELAEHDDRHVHAHEATPRDRSDDGAAYRCPMHPEVRSNEPGRCPECGMALVPVDRSSAP
jgi:uncharacterized membrane protein YraQ (UPF0718 family)